MRRQKPVSGEPPRDFERRMRCVTHPACRLGFLDALAGKPVNHDRIMERIERETPASSLKRIGWLHADLLGPFGESETAVAQYRYEEGRQLVTEVGLRCKAWGHPDYPPKQVVEFCRKQV